MATNSDGAGLDVANMRHTLVSARDRDLIILFVPEITDDEMETVEHFMEAVSDTTKATLAVLPANVVADCRNYTLKDLLDLREVIDDLIADRIGKFPVIEV